MTISSMGIYSPDETTPLLTPGLHIKTYLGHTYQKAASPSEEWIDLLFREIDYSSRSVKPLSFRPLNKDRAKEVLTLILEKRLKNAENLSLLRKAEELELNPSFFPLSALLLEGILHHCRSLKRITIVYLTEKGPGSLLIPLKDYSMLSQTETLRYFLNSTLINKKNFRLTVINPPWELFNLLTEVESLHLYRNLAKQDKKLAQSILMEVIAQLTKRSLKSPQDLPNQTCLNLKMIFSDLPKADLDFYQLCLKDLPSILT